MTLILVLTGSISRRTTPNLLARAFTSTANNFPQRTAALSSNTNPPPSCFPPRHHFSSSSQSASSLEEDLDAALEDILKPVTASSKNNRGSGGGATTETMSDDELSSELEDILRPSTATQQRRRTPSSPRDQENSNTDLSSSWDDPTHHIKDSHPLPPALVEEDPIDLTDPSHLSTSNPHWITSGLDPDIIPILSAKGITKFTPVQAEAYRPVIAGRDVIGRSRTGTGKTLAFGLPAMARLERQLRESGMKNARGRMPGIVVLCPTRELARQVAEELTEVSRPLGLFVECFHGGVSYGPQAQAIRRGIDVLVGTPGRVIDHLQRRNIDFSTTSTVVLDEADEMLNMGFAEDVETILEGMGSDNEEKMQCLLFSATTPPWVENIGKQYQKDVLFIDSTSAQEGARTATTVRHVAIQVPFGIDSRKQILEDVIAVEISKDSSEDSDSDDEFADDIAKAAKKAKSNTNHALQQKIFGKTIVFTETKAMADELASGSVFKSLTAQSLHGDVGQKQRDATLAAFRKGAFNVLIATDVAARGIDIRDVDLVVQVSPPRNTDTYVHRSGRTGRAGQSGVSVMFFDNRESRDVVRIERDLGHGFQFDLMGPPSAKAALNAAAKTSAVACRSVSDETAKYFKDAAKTLLEEDDMEPEDIVAKCLAAISRRGADDIQSRSLLTGEVGMVTVEMTNARGRNVTPKDVMFTVGKLSRMSYKEDTETRFAGDVGKIQSNFDTGTAVFDMSVEDAKKLCAFSQGVDAGGASFSIIEQFDVSRGRFFGMPPNRQGGGGGRFNKGGRFSNNRGPPRSYGGGGGYSNNRGGGYNRSYDRGGGNNRSYDRGGRGGYDGRRGGGAGGSRWE
eukprot:CAMPEP_0172505138 /NCGR_PEP_ID=MMETSP1066-20121228/183934_1 /TAXON_ID=671091 /ORGANISM="Coscinodiscus wailesii, Strain CCMP2513" /LENGTH=851 /DNA_ID=CAMNT_0013281623 /DNA_START=357 /DNA_END=2909 /DNA_ORIENTATION=-